eukprot:8542435-Heterocapsa_arctica.AAC.1
MFWDLVHCDSERGQLVRFLVTVPIFSGSQSFMDIHFLHVRGYPLDSQVSGRSQLECIHGPSMQVRVLSMRDQPSI